MSRLDDDDLVINLPLKLTLRVDQRSCSSYTMSYDTPSNRGVVYTLAGGPRTTGNTALDNCMSRSLQKVAPRRAFEPKAVALSSEDALLQKHMISDANIKPKGTLTTYEHDVHRRPAL